MNAPSTVTIKRGKSEVCRRAGLLDAQLISLDRPIDAGHPSGPDLWALLISLETNEIGEDTAELCRKVANSVQGSSNLQNKLRRPTTSGPTANYKVFFAKQMPGASEVAQVLRV